VPILLYSKDVRQTSRPFHFVVLRELELRHFRNLGVQELHFPPEGVAVVGDNAQGKTNLLEAVYYLESFRSFRGAADRELAAFSQDVFYLRGAVEGSARTTVAAGFDCRRKNKKVTVDGDDTLRLSAALGRLGAVVFSPADVRLINDGPSVRRRFLDIVLSLNRPGYVDALLEYRKWLAQRNAALRTAGGTTGQQDWIRAWDNGLVTAGASVTCMRRTWASEWSGSFAEYYGAISDGEAATMSYRPNLGEATAPDGSSPPVSGEASARERFRKRLDESWENDLRRGATSAGPHRDELLFTVGAGGRSMPLRGFGSGGQRRTAALALRLTEAATIRRQRGAEPILLLDDAFAELDTGRSGRVMSLLEEAVTGQVIMTVPKESDAGLPGRSLERWRIHGGVIEA